jgi:tripartite-type tricarboxylate transporter receptor subunit TctC
MNRIPRFAASAIAALAVVAGAVHAQNYPSKPVKLIVPYPAGGVVDLVGRAVADKISTAWGQPILVEPRPGANGNIGAEYVKSQPADGYTFMMGAPFLSVNPVLDPQVRFKTSDFVAVGLIGAPPNLFVVPASLPVNSLKEFVDYAKTRPGKLNVANPGTGSSNHLGQEVFFQATGIELVSVPYKGQPASIPDMMSGQISFAVMTNALAIPHIKTGKLKALAISAPVRSKELPEVPTLAEAGFSPEVMVLPWYGIVAPAGTPQEPIARMNAEINKALSTPEVIERLEKIGTIIMGGTPAEFDRLIKAEEVRWAKLVKERNIKPE